MGGHHEVKVFSWWATFENSTETQAFVLPEGWKPFASETHFVQERVVVSVTARKWIRKEKS